MILVSNEFWQLESLPTEGYCVLRRTAKRADDLSALRSANVEVAGYFEPHHKSWGLIVDMRKAAPRNDEAFEDAMRPLRTRVSQHFARVVLLLSSAVGVLQVERLRAHEGNSWLATRSESEAITLARDASP